jgi:hypothetical protein
MHGITLMTHLNGKLGLVNEVKTWDMVAVTMKEGGTVEEVSGVWRVERREGDTRGRARRPGRRGRRDAQRACAGRRAWGREERVRKGGGEAEAEEIVRVRPDSVDGAHWPGGAAGGAACGRSRCRASGSRCCRRGWGS